MDIRPLVPTDDVQTELVQPAIALVKAEEVDSARSMLELALDTLLDAGAARAIMGCTEIPVALEHSSKATVLLGATAALAAACIAICQASPIEALASPEREGPSGSPRMSAAFGTPRTSHPSLRISSSGL